MNNNYDVAMIHRGSINPGWVTSAIEAFSYYPWNHLWIAAGKRLVFDKNNITKEWLAAGETDWLIWSDEGIAFDPDAMEKLVTFTDEPSVVAGLAWYLHGDQHTIYPGIFTHDAGAKLVASLTQEPPTVPTKVPGTGGIFMAIHREVAQAILDATDPRDLDYPFFLTTRTEMEGIPTGYSEMFAMRVRDAGYPYWVLPDVKITHYETIAVTGRPLV